MNNVEKELHAATSSLKHRVVFVSHGAPTLVIEHEQPTNHFLTQLGKEIGKPSAIICISAHWEARVVEVNTAAKPEQIYDFGGFSDELYRQIYHPPGSPELASEIIEVLKGHNIAVEGNSRHGLDHGTWCPLKLMYPDADVPVVQVSLVRGLDPVLHQRIGEALASLLEKHENVLLLASGGVTHNLGELFTVYGQSDPTKPAAWAKEFDEWVEDVLTSQEGESRATAMVAFNNQRYAKKAHPRTEHFIPLVAVAGMKSTGKAVKLHGAFFYDLSLAAYAFPLPRS